jgi:transcriptional regulator with XRE-family HTH domain
MTSLADDIYTWRVTFRLSQEEAARLAGVSLATWSRWERGITAPGPVDYATLRWLIAQPPAGWVRS